MMAGNTSIKLGTVDALRKIAVEDVVFTQGAGLTFENGKSKYPTLLRLDVDRKRAMELAISILQSLKTDEPGVGDYINLTFFGQLEQMPKD